MADKIIQKMPIPEESEATEQTNKQDVLVPPKLVPDKPATPPSTTVVAPSPRMTLPGFTKMEPNDLYRRLLPAVLFVLTFVTVMTMLLIYMDTVALGAQQFRLNMSRDYELAKIPQSSPPLVAYVRQLHLAPRPPRGPQPAPTATKSVEILDQTLGDIYNGTFIEFLPSGPRSQTTMYLEAARQWDGVIVRAAARDYLALRANARAAHACLSTTDHPREVSYQESESSDSVFRSRVLCLPLYTLLLAAEATRCDYVLLSAPPALPALHHLPFHEVTLRATRCDYVLLSAPPALPALHHLPFHEVTLRMIEIRTSDASYRNKTTSFLATKNYTLAASLPDSVMYVLNQPTPL